MSSEKEFRDNLMNIMKKLQSMKNYGEENTMDELRQMLDAMNIKQNNVWDLLNNGDRSACMKDMDEAYDLLDHMTASASEMNPEMEHILSTLSGIKRKLASMKRENNCALEDLRHYQQMLNSIDNKRVDGIFAGSPSTAIPAGQGRCVEVLSECYELVEDLRRVAHNLNPEMEKLFNNLVGIRKELVEMKSMVHMLSHLHPFQVELDEIDKARDEGVFCGSLKSGKIPAGQAVCADLLNECYHLVRHLQSTSLNYGK